MLKLSRRLIFAAVGCVALAGSACGGDDTVPLEPVTYELSVTGYNGGLGNEATVYCDGTLAVTVSIAPADAFRLRPANACGTAPRCGYVHFELLQGGTVVSTADSATVQGVLRLPDPSNIENVELQVSLRSGVDQETILNADGEKAIQTVTPMLKSPTDCEGTGAGGAPSGGAGAGGQPSEPAAGAGGAGGASDALPGGAGGAGGDAPGGQGGAPVGGEAASAGSGGA